jgi:DNA (cytosine-5)-methyltransferase 1
LRSRIPSGVENSTTTAVLQPTPFDTTQITSPANYSNPKPGDQCHPLAAGAHAPAVAWSIMPQNSGRDYKARQVDVLQPLMAGGVQHGNQGGDIIQTAMQVRRLTPVECERLQGFPDNYTAIPWRKKTASECPDGPRYKALGNSWAVPVVRWIGSRINAMLEHQ